VPPEPTERVQRHVVELFPPEERETVSAVLTDDCGDNLALMDDPRLLERIRIAALKMSGGDLAKLRQAVEIAQVDWRDLLVAAGFGHDPLAHEKWRPSGG
jgi:hypothetical protein